MKNKLNDNYILSMNLP